VKLSVVATLYHSAAFVDEFCQRAKAAAQRLVGEDYEIILVNDGSPDRSLEHALAQSAADARVVVVDLSRNFGHYKAIMTGLAHARGEAVFLIDSDLEEEPEWLASFATQLAQAGCDVVYGVQKSRKGGWFERASGYLFYKLFRAATGLDMPESFTTARLMTRRYVEALLQHEEREIFLAGLWVITGFEQRAQAVVKHSKGQSTYTLRRKMGVFVNSLTSFSNAPLIGIFYTGAAISAASGAYILFVIVNWLGLQRPPTGWTSLIASVWLLGGLTISFLGVIGIYLSKIFSETKRRPYTIVRQVYDRREPRPGAAAARCPAHEL
jgi:putative glycosyltransferase